MNKKMRVAVIFSLILLSITGSAAAQGDGELTVSLSRDFGYGGFAGDIEGLFTIRAEGPDSLVKVIFYIDDQIMLEDSSPPFSYQFQTGNYSIGSHVLYAVGYLGGGGELVSNKLSRTFVSPEVGTEMAMKIVLPLLAIVGVFMLVSFLVPVLMDRKRTPLPLGAPRQYGVLGGAICPKCGRPFSIHFLSVNISFLGKFDRCPHCGKWSLVRRSSPADLAAAEQAELDGAQGQSGVGGASQKDQLKREIDDSRFTE